MHTPALSEIISTFGVRAFRHFLSPAVNGAGFRLASITNTEVNPSHACGSPYLLLTGLRFSRLSQWSSAAELFRTLHFQQDVRRFSSLHAPPIENASTWSIAAPSSSSRGAFPSSVRMIIRQPGSDTRILHFRFQQTQGRRENNWPLAPTTEPSITAEDRNLQSLCKFLSLWLVADRGHHLVSVVFREFLQATFRSADRGAAVWKTGSSARADPYCPNFLKTVTLVPFAREGAVKETQMRTGCLLIKRKWLDQWYSRRLSRPLQDHVHGRDHVGVATGVAHVADFSFVRDRRARAFRFGSGSGVRRCGR